MIITIHTIETLLEGAKARDAHRVLVSSRDYYALARGSSASVRGIPRDGFSVEREGYQLEIAPDVALDDGAARFE